jgi:gamma-glutamylaminecyclotransferase
MTLVFVYGTLKRGGTNHHYIAGQQFVAEARTEPRFRLYELEGFPGMIVDPENGLSVQGEIWAVDDTALALLDELEGIDLGIYARQPIPLLPPHHTLAVEGYLYLRPIVGRRDLGGFWAV